MFRCQYSSIKKKKKRKKKRREEEHLRVDVVVALPFALRQVDEQAFALLVAEVFALEVEQRRVFVFAHERKVREGMLRVLLNGGLK